jgi:hypothetical protein
MNAIPMTAGDLRELAEALDEIEATPLAASKCIGRIEAYLPDGEAQVGWFVRFDDSDPDMGWGIELSGTFDGLRVA